MKRLYTIVYVNRSELRDSKIEALLSDDYQEKTFDGVHEYFYSKNGKLQKEMDFKIKSYKTLRGAQNEVNKITRLRAGKTIKRTTGYSYNGRWTYDVNFDPSTHAFVILDVTERWNEMVDKEISKKTASFQIELQKLKDKKVL